MRRKQWGTLLLGVLSLAADCFFAPYGLFAAGVAVLVVLLLLVFRQK